jgi:hypothetical protein
MRSAELDWFRPDTSPSGYCPQFSRLSAGSITLYEHPEPAFRQGGIQGNLGATLRRAVPDHTGGKHNEWRCCKEQCHE